MKSQSWNDVNQLVVDHQCVDALLRIGPHLPPVLHRGLQALADRSHNQDVPPAPLPAVLLLLDRLLLNVDDLLFALLPLLDHHRKTVVQQLPDVLPAPLLLVVPDPTSAPDHRPLSVDELPSVPHHLGGLVLLRVLGLHLLNEGDLLCVLHLFNEGDLLYVLHLLGVHPALPLVAQAPVSVLALHCRSVLLVFNLFNGALDHRHPDASLRVRLPPDVVQ